MDHHSPQCPKCAQPMDLRQQGDVEVEICPTCEGIWLDAGEFNRLVVSRFPHIPDEDGFGPDAISLTPLQCPRGHGSMRVLGVYGIELDRCQVCRGIWMEREDRAQIKDVEPPEASIPLPAQTPGEDITRHTQDPQESVCCAGCGAFTPRAKNIVRLGEFFCEHCVVEGNYPGGTGPPIQRRIREAAIVQAQENSRLSKARAARDLRNVNSERITFYRGKQVKGAFTYEEYVLAFERLKDWFDGVFNRRNEKKK